MTAEAPTASAAFDSEREGRLEGRPAQRLAELFEAHAATVLAICRRMLRNAHDAEDAAQQTFLSAYASLADGTVPREPAAWLATIARNECRTRAHQRMREPLPDAELEPVGGMNPADHAIRAEEVTSLRRALAGLPGQQRHAFVLREFSGLSYDELADELGVTRPAVESLLFRARRRLRVSLRTALAGLASVPASVRDWVAALFGSSPETPAAAAKLATLGVVTKIAAATAGSALVAATVVAVAPHRRHAAHPAPPAIADVSAPVRHVVHRPVRVAMPPVGHAVVHSRPVQATERHSRSGESESGDRGAASARREVSATSSGDGERQTEPVHQDSSSSGPGPSGGDPATTGDRATTASSADGSSGGGPDGGGQDSGRGSDSGSPDSSNSSD